MTDEARTAFEAWNTPRSNHDGCFEAFTAGRASLEGDVERLAQEHDYQKRRCAGLACDIEGLERERDKWRVRAECAEHNDDTTLTLLEEARAEVERLREERDALRELLAVSKQATRLETVHAEKAEHDAARARAEGRAEGLEAAKSACNTERIKALLRWNMPPPLYTEQDARMVKKATEACCVAVAALAAAPPTESRDWTEDRDHENGNYQNVCRICGEKFIGHKRRVVCRLCAAAPPTETGACPRCGAEYADGECVNLDCPTNAPPTEEKTCARCGGTGFVNAEPRVPVRCPECGMGLTPPEHTEER